ncbi:MAG: hypothetical protein V1827_04645 [Candidatus Micrarchaeota archaeon]
MPMDILNDESKDRIVSIWRGMSETDKAHFINQVALAMSVWGSDEAGRRLVVDVLGLMTSNGTSTLADFGLYIEGAISAKKATGMDEKIKRAAIIVEGYRIKNALPSEPHRELV